MLVQRLAILGFYNFYTKDSLCTSINKYYLYVRLQKLFISFGPISSPCPIAKLEKDFSSVYTPTPTGARVAYLLCTATGIHCLSRALFSQNQVLMRIKDKWQSLLETQFKHSSSLVSALFLDLFLFDFFFNSEISWNCSCISDVVFSLSFWNGLPHLERPSRS